MCPLGPTALLLVALALPRATDDPLVVDGETVDPAAIAARAGADPHPEDVRRAKLWFARTTAARRALAAEGAWLDDAAAAAHREAVEASYAGGLFPLEDFATDFFGYLDLEDYFVQQRVEESLRRWIADELTDEALEAHLEARGARFLGLGEVDCEVIFTSARDFEADAWAEGGWARAREKADAARSALDLGVSWDEVLDLYTEFEEQPPDLSGNHFGAKRGRFGSVNRNVLVHHLGESEYERFLTGVSIADHVFFEQEEGTVAGPFRGPYGYYLARVTGRTPPRMTLDLADPTHRTLVEKDLVDARLARFVQDAFDAADVQGLADAP